MILKSSVEEEELLREVALFALSQWSRLRRDQQKEITRQRHQVLKLASGIAHEIANDVTVIGSHLRRIEKLFDRNALTSDNFKTQLQHISNVIQRSVRMTSLLRAHASRWEPQLELETASLEAIVRAALAEGKYASISAHIGTCPGEVYCDPEMLKRVIMIICDNALKYAGERPEIHFEFEQVDAPINAFLVDIEDTGFGIAAEFRERIFLPGDRGPINTLERLGWGLGLAFARTLVEAHVGTGIRGSLQCLAPRHGNGARFRISLPRSRT